jgi:hypothetical protein
MSDDSRVITKIMEAVGRPVRFRYPAGEKHKIGLLVERAVVRNNPRTRGVPYWNVVDLIEFPHEKVPRWLRIGYYRKPKNRLQWGSQTTTTEPIETWKRILIEAARQKPWFRDLLIGVVAELKKKGRT